MTIYLVDFENVKSEGLNGINSLSSKDQVEIFYSVNADKITFSLHKKMNESNAKINFHKIEVGIKNALDFQLVTYLGYLIGKNESSEYVIVSGDTGFNIVASFWQKKNHNVSVVADLSRTNMQEVQDDLYKSVSQLVKDEKDAKLLTEYILKYKTKQGLNNAIVKVYGTSVGGTLYNNIKPLIKDKRGK